MPEPNPLERMALFQVELEDLAAKYGYELAPTNGGCAFWPIYGANGGISTGLAVQFNRKKEI